MAQGELEVGLAAASPSGIIAADPQRYVNCLCLPPRILSLPP
jgi:hypothetical protein